MSNSEVISTFTFYREYEGYCRVYVKSETSLYCFQQERRNTPPIMYVCTDEGEPSYPVTIPHNSELKMEGCEYLKTEILEAFNRGDYFIKAKKHNT